MKKSAATHATLSPEAQTHIQTAWTALLNSHLPNGYVLVQAAFEHEAGHWYLRAYVDTLQKDIRLDQCAELAHLLDPFVETLPIPASVVYSLEVSSPGLFRTLLSPQEVQFYLGEPVWLRWGQKKPVTGTLSQYDPGTDTVTLQLKADSPSFPRAECEIRLNPTIRKNVVPLQLNNEETAHD